MHSLRKFRIETMYVIAQLFMLFSFEQISAETRYREKVFPQSFNHTVLVSQKNQQEANVETLIEKLLLAGDLISAETLWKEEMDRLPDRLPPTPDSKNAFVNNPINFKSVQGYLVTRLQLHGTFSIYFQLKTTKLDGLIMYAGPLLPGGQDFIALELSGGVVRFVFDVGTGIHVVRSNLKQGISDNEWHDVGILRPTLTQHILRVDDSARPDPLPDDDEYYELSDEFYMGGLPDHLFDSLPKQIKSRHGFQGCLGSIDLNGESQNLLEDEKAMMLDGNVVSGCEDTLARSRDPNVECSATSCSNGGLCIQHWDTFTCDCELTSFTGPTCDDDGVAYSFGDGGGLIRCNFLEGLSLNSLLMRLAFGIHTLVSDAVLVHFESQDSKDFIQLELVDGKIVVIHRIGTKDHILKGNHKVNDGTYHTVRFIRNDYNSTLQVDEHPPVYKSYEENDGLFAVGRLTVYIGSQAYPKNGLVKPFYGSIAGSTKFTSTFKL